MILSAYTKLSPGSHQLIQYRPYYKHSGKQYIMNYKNFSLMSRTAFIAETSSQIQGHRLLPGQSRGYHILWIQYQDYPLSYG